MPSIPLTFRPLTAWPQEPTKNRKRSPFQASWPVTIEALDRELRHLGARSAVIQLALTEADIRQGGYPRANARPSHPGVVLAFESKFGPLKYATDAFTDWQSNVRAIALGLDALRRVDRYGITKRGEQYTGWKGIPATTGGGPQTVEQAARILTSMGGGDAGQVALSVTYAGDVYRRAAKAVHPDTGGTVEDFQRLQEAKRVLDRHHGKG